MIDPAKRPAPRPANAGGFLLAAALMLGTFTGLALGEPSIGFLAGLAVGVIIAVAIWLHGRG
jgi:predicted lipid-binding transport protein (Tim44 family)